MLRSSKKYGIIASPSKKPRPLKGLLIEAREAGAKGYTCNTWGQITITGFEDVQTQVEGHFEAITLKIPKSKAQIVVFYNEEILLTGGGHYNMMATRLVGYLLAKARADRLNKRRKKKSKLLTPRDVYPDICMKEIRGSVVILGINTLTCDERSLTKNQRITLEKLVRDLTKNPCDNDTEGVPGWFV